MVSTLLVMYLLGGKRIMGNSGKVDWNGILQPYDVVVVWKRKSPLVGKQQQQQRITVYYLPLTIPGYDDQILGLT
jgi:hypothetical protein